MMRMNIKEQEGKRRGLFASDYVMKPVKETIWPFLISKLFLLS